MRFFLLLVVLSSFGTNLLAQTLTITRSQPTLYEISLDQLLARPEQYEGQLVRLKGYLNLAYEAHAIYSQQADVANHRSKNGLWVNFSTAVKKERLADCNHAYVVVVGTFDTHSKGHLGLFGGTLKNIISLDK